MTQGSTAAKPTHLSASNIAVGPEISEMRNSLFLWGLLLSAAFVLTPEIDEP